MADLTALQAELDATIQTIEEVRIARMEAFLAARREEEEAKAAAEAAKTDAQKAADLQAQIDAAKAHLAELQA